MDQVLLRDGVSGQNVAEMLTACAIGMVVICGTDEKLFRQRLAAMVDTLILGLRSKMKLGDEVRLSKRSRQTQKAAEPG